MGLLACFLVGIVALFKGMALPHILTELVDIEFYEAWAKLQKKLEEE